MVREQIIIDVVMKENVKNRFRKIKTDLTSEFSKQARGLVTYNVNLKRQFQLYKENKRASERFKMELLSLGFGFQMINQAMMGLLSPAFETVGVFEVLATMLQITFLPIAMFLLEFILLPMLELFSIIPEPIQFMIGAIVGLVAAIASLGSVASFMGLFIDKFVAGITLIKQIFAPFISFLTPAFMAIVAVLAIVVIAIVGFFRAWKENFGRIRDWVQVIVGGITQAIGGIKKVISGIIDFFVGIFTGDTSKIKEGFTKFFGGIADIFSGIFKTFLGTIVTLGLSLLRGIIMLLPQPLEKLVLKFFKLDEKPKGSNQTGGVIPYTGLYKLHRGETVLPPEQNLNFSPTINITGGSGMDAISISRMIKMELNQTWAAELGRLARR